MKERNNKLLSKGTLLIILILFMFSSKISDITWNIAKYFFYFILIINGVNYLNPSIAEQIKEIIIDLINIDSNGYFIKDILSKLSGIILNKPNNNLNLNLNLNDIPNDNLNGDTTVDMVPLNDTSINENYRNLHNDQSVTSTRRLN